MLHLVEGKGKDKGAAHRRILSDAAPKRMALLGAGGAVSGAAPTVKQRVRAVAEFFHGKTEARFVSEVS